jgi:hypothetical protein
MHGQKLKFVVMATQVAENPAKPAFFQCRFSRGFWSGGLACVMEQILR